MTQIPAKLQLPANFVPFTKESCIRNLRNTLLAQVDRVNPVWYANLSDEQRNELGAYRAALLEVPQQPGFPDTISWPSKPSWLG